MVCAGFGDNWRCLFANDFDRKKAATYRRNWGSGEMHCGDVRDVTTDDLPDEADLAWASFPCQDLSLARKRLWDFAAVAVMMGGTTLLLTARRV